VLRVVVHAEAASYASDRVVGLLQPIARLLHDPGDECAWDESEAVPALKRQVPLRERSNRLLVLGVGKDVCIGADAALPVRYGAAHV
jgi:hypothetical protein